MSEIHSTTSAHKALNATLDATLNSSADALRPVLDQLVAGLHGAVERLNDAANRAVQQVEQTGECLKDAQSRVAGGARGYVRAQPLTTVGIALASGFLLSWALRQR